MNNPEEYYSFDVLLEQRKKFYKALYSFLETLFETLSESTKDPYVRIVKYHGLVKINKLLEYKIIKAPKIKTAHF